MLHVFNRELDGRLPAIELSQEVRESLDEQRVRLAGIEPPPSLDPETRAAIEQAVADSFVTGFRGVMLVSAGLALASGFSAWLLIEGKAPRRKVKAIGETYVIDPDSRGDDRARARRVETPNRTVTQANVSISRP